MPLGGFSADDAGSVGTPGLGAVDCNIQADDIDGMRSKSGESIALGFDEGREIAFAIGCRLWTTLYAPCSWAGEAGWKPMRRCLRPLGCVGCDGGGRGGAGWLLSGGSTPRRGPPWVGDPRRWHWSSSKLCSAAWCSGHFVAILV